MKNNLKNTLVMLAIIAIPVLFFLIDYVHNKNAPHLSNQEIQAVLAETRVELRIVSEISLNEFVYFHLINHTENYFGYGHGSRLYKRRGNRWINIPFRSVIFQEMLIVPPNSYRVSWVHLAHDFGNLRSGEYVLVQEMIEDLRPLGFMEERQRETFFVATPFTL
ncbi:MAG: hypothetical protein FWC16_01265 [Defluviitaleaceae bacterium]|nr:hypothetical protein [Defluviitaleaceae bacterium]MCL2273533.1 hypothetical protein [Defluviitaleaceae bacterium]